MANRNFYDGTDAELASGTQIFSAAIVGDEALWGLTVGQSGSYSALSGQFIAAYNTAINPATRTKGAVNAKNVLRSQLRIAARDLVSIINGNPIVTDQMKIDVNLHVRDTSPTPIPAPETAPLINVIQVAGSVATITLRDVENQDKRARPRGVAGANVFSFVGDNPPASPSQWQFEGQVTKTKFELDLGSELEAATKVWLTACWYNPRTETGPVSDPIFTFTQAGGTSVEFGVLKMAA